jgi:hypothetical protein
VKRASLLALCVAARAHAEPPCAPAGSSIAGRVWPGERSAIVCVDDGRCARWDLASRAFAAARWPEDPPRDPDLELADTSAREITLCSEEGDSCRSLAPPGYHPGKERIHARLDAAHARVVIDAGDALLVYEIGDRLKKLATVRAPDPRWRDALSAVWVGDALLVSGAHGDRVRHWLVDARRGRVLGAIGDGPVVHTRGAVAYLAADGVHVVGADGKPRWVVDADAIYGAHTAPPALRALGGETILVVYDQGFVVIDARSGAHELARLPSC